MARSSAPLLQLARHDDMEYLLGDIQKIVRRIAQVQRKRFDVHRLYAFNLWALGGVFGHLQRFQGSLKMPVGVCDMPLDGCDSVHDDATRCRVEWRPGD